MSTYPRTGLWPSLALLVALVLPAPPAEASTSAATERVLAEVSQKYGGGDIEGARTQLIGAMKKAPSEIPLHVAYIEMMIGLGSREAVEGVYAGLIETNKADAVSLYLHGLTLATPKEREEAFKASVKAAPTFPWAHLGLASTALSRGEPDLALSHARDALVLDQTLEPALELFGSLLAARGQVEEAIITYEALAEQDTSNARALEALGRLYTMSGAPDKAVGAMKRGTAVEPENATLHANLGHLYFQRRAFSEALASYREASRLVPEDELSALMVSITQRVMAGTLTFESVQEVQQARSLEGRDWPRATTLYLSAAGRDPSFELAHLGLGNVYLAQGEMKKAGESLKKALDLAPESSEVRVAYARLMVEVGALGEAEKHLRKALERQPQNVEILLSLAELYRKLGDPRRAEVAYRGALPYLSGDDAQATVVNIAGSLAAQGKLKDSVSLLEEVLKESGPNVDLYLTLGEIYREMEDYGRSLSVFQRVLELEAGHPDALAQQALTQEAWEVHKENVRTKNRASQILVKDKASADALLAELKGGADFADLARRKSTGREAVDGGDLGFFEPGSLASPLGEALTALPVGGLTGVIKTDAGYHILKRTN